MRSRFLSFVICAALLAGCAQRSTSTAGSPPVGPAGASPAAPPGLPRDVLNVTWQWVNLATPGETVTPDAPERYTLRFEPGRVTVRADCNSGTGAYSAPGDRRLAISAIALTRVGCSAGSLSDRFATEVTRATSYFVKDGSFFLELPGGAGTLQFRPSA